MKCSDLFNNINSIWSYQLFWISLKMSFTIHFYIRYNSCTSFDTTNIWPYQQEEGYDSNLLYIPKEKSHCYWCKQSNLLAYGKQWEMFYLPTACFSWNALFLLILNDINIVFYYWIKVQPIALSYIYMNIELWSSFPLELKRQFIFFIKVTDNIVWSR